MTIIKAKDARKMNKKEINENLKELKMELIRANVVANRTNAKTKEIKRAISRLKTINKSSKEGELNKK